MYLNSKSKEKKNSVFENKYPNHKPIVDISNFPL